ncbi:MAG TPA: 4Fe-4S dicluster domain-containing protein [bacterium]|nr:4Fe-4S dicluster domain-containing protein [bacterium]
MDNDGTRIKRGFARRDFLKVSGAFSVALSAGLASAAEPGLTLEASSIHSEYPVAQGYILVDMKKCQGCQTCMLACSLAHHGRENVSLACIQVAQDPFEKWPYDIIISQCRQCVDPECLAACPEKDRALRVDQEHGNVRTIDPRECIGCRECVDACPYAPGRSIWNFEEEVAGKCDLCADTPFWNETGGPQGKQACVELCPVKAIAFSSAVPVQEGDAGYNVDLRGAAWGRMGFPTD